MGEHASVKGLFLRLHDVQFDGFVPSAPVVASSARVGTKRGTARVFLGDSGIGCKSIGLWASSDCLIQSVCTVMMREKANDGTAGLSFESWQGGDWGVCREAQHCHFF